MASARDKDFQSSSGSATDGRTFSWLGGLKAFREERDLSLDDVSGRSGVHRNTINELENLKRPAYPRTAHKLARALEVDLTELLGPQG